MLIKNDGSSVIFSLTFIKRLGWKFATVSMFYVCLSAIYLSIYNFCDKYLSPRIIIHRFFNFVLRHADYSPPQFLPPSFYSQVKISSRDSPPLQPFNSLFPRAMCEFRLIDDLHRTVYAFKLLMECREVGRKLKR